MMHKGTFPRAAIRARKRTLVHHRAETLRAEKIGALSDQNLTFFLFRHDFDVSSVLGRLFPRPRSIVIAINLDASIVKNASTVYN